MTSHRDTIFALSSGQPPAAIGVVRVSGPNARAALEILAGRLPAPRQASLARLRDPANGEIIDEALALWFPSPRSETGEDMAELQLHGGRAVIAAIFAALGQLPGFRPAEAGEFTRRAFENGRLDLTAVEGLADLIGAETEAQRRQAYRQLKGMLGDRAEAWRGRLIEALALVEAGIDFSDEGGVPQDLVVPALDIACSLHEEIAGVLAQAGSGERLRDGLVVAIAGPPNAGKSTLLNRIAKREAAIVSPYAGTTRDVIEVHLDLGGYPVTLLDTAGLRDTEDPVEQEGVRRARERAAAADLVLWVVEARSLADFHFHGLGQPAADRYGCHGPQADLATHSGAQAGIGPMADTADVAEQTGISGSVADRTGPLAELFGTTPVWLICNKADLLAAAPSSGPLADRQRPEPIRAQKLSSGTKNASGPCRPMADAPVAQSPESDKSSGTAELPRGYAPVPHVADSAQPLTQGSSIAAAARQLLAGPIKAASRSAADALEDESLGQRSFGPITAGEPSRAVADAPVATPAAVGTGFSAASQHSQAAVTHTPKNEHISDCEFRFTFTISARDGTGVGDLLEALKSHVLRFFGPETGLVTRERHRHALQEAQTALARALAETTGGREEILAEELRLASRALGRLTGKVDVEDILDVIFRDFCIGK